MDKRALGLVLVGCMAFAERAVASDVFPQVIRDEWKVSDLGVGGSGCRVCHLSDPGVLNNVSQKFGLTVKEYGVPLRNTTALKNALRQMRADRTDSDGDAITDYDEFVNGTNVNVFDVPKPPPDPGLGGNGDGGAQGGGPDPGQGGSVDGIGGNPSMQPGGPTEPSPASTLPVPETGCRVARGPGGRSPAFLLALIALGPALGLRRRSRTYGSKYLLANVAR